MKAAQLLILTFAIFLLGFGEVAQSQPNKIYFKSTAQKVPFPILNSQPVSGFLRSATSAHLLYYGGPVISNIKIVSVFWTSQVDSTVQGQIGNFYGALTNSTYMDWLKEYDTNVKSQSGMSGTNQTIGRGSFAGSYTISPSQTTGTIDDTGIQTELAKQVAAGKLPLPDENTVYMIHFPPGVTITQAGYTSCQDFCAYHSSYKDGAKDLYYGIMPDFASSACSEGCGDSDNFSNFTAVASHEVMESITDPQVGYITGNDPTNPMAWYDPNNGEAGDICVGTTGTIKSSAGAAYNVQGIWSNKDNACIQAPGVAAIGTPEQP